ncbi:zinc-binding protein A33-like [Engraulis encrasicolus]|uniref:zinc-binding protein A33-like n=1 Tax=Engraulis encrasicolus TaxID=184585 RepID=UPI002FD4DFF7
MKEKIKQMDKDLASLSDSIKAIEETGSDDVSFLQNYRSTVERAQCTLQDPEKLPQGALVNVAKHLGNLKFRVWEKMKDLVQYTPVILDPNTAHPKLLLSEDLGDVKGKLALPLLPDNPERFGWLPAVLGSEGFTSGRHCWDVQVGEAEPWSLGVITESNQRKGHMDLKGLWVMFYGKNKCGMYAASHKTDLVVRQRPQRIRVQLDLDRRKLTFSDPDNNKHIHASLHAFTERVFPYFCGSSFKILQSKAAVTVWQ